jgi:hypothetical protein
LRPVLAAEVPDSAISSIDSDPAPEGFFDTRRPPDLVQLAQSFAHGDRHLNTGERVLVDATCLGIAKEDHDGVATYLSIVAPF